MQQIKITVYDGYETDIKYQGIHNVSDAGGDILDIQLPYYLFISSNLGMKVENLSTSINYYVKLESYIELSGGLFAPIINGKQVYTGQVLSLLEKDKLDGIKESYLTRFFTGLGNDINNSGIKFSNILDKNNPNYKEYINFFNRNASIGCNNNVTLLRNDNNIKVIGNNNTIGASGNETYVNLLGNYNTFNTGNYYFGTTIIGNNNNVTSNNGIVIGNYNNTNENNSIIICNKDNNGNDIGGLNIGNIFKHNRDLKVTTIGKNRSGTEYNTHGMYELNYSDDLGNPKMDNFKTTFTKKQIGGGNFLLNNYEGTNYNISGFGHFDLDCTIQRGNEFKRLKLEGIFNAYNRTIDYNTTTVAELGTPGSDLGISVSAAPGGSGGVLLIGCNSNSGADVFATAKLQFSLIK